MGYLARIHHGESSIDFPKLWRPAIVISALLMLLGIGSIFTRGINFSIEFEGGTLWEVRAPNVSVSDARDFLKPLGEGEAKIQIVNGNTLRIQSQLKDPNRANQIKTELEKLGPVDTVNSVGPTWGGEITRKAERALVIFFVLLSLYIWWRLEWRMAIGAMVAVVHRLDALDRIEFAYRHPGVAQVLEVGLRRADRADAVVHDVDLDAAFHLFGEQRGELLGELAAVEDISLDVDVVARGGDRLEHRPVRARAIHQEARLVAADERIFGGSGLRRRTGVRRRQRACRQDRQPRR